jgi:hypothetical protein
MHYHRRGCEVVTKADQTPVTQADQESEALILAALRKLAPTIPVVAEEEVAIPWTEHANSFRAGLSSQSTLHWSSTRAPFLALSMRQARGIFS